jgi:hypothetical protein
MTSRKVGTASRQVAKAGTDVLRLGDSSSSHRTYIGMIFSHPFVAIQENKAHQNSVFLQPDGPDLGGGVDKWPDFLQQEVSGDQSHSLSHLGACVSTVGL